jgi:hypothetical protein
MAKFKHLGMLTEQNGINEEQTEFRECLLNSVQNLLSSCLFSKNIKIKLCGIAIWSTNMGVKLGLSN